MSNDELRLSSCPDGFCCARDQFLASYIYCKRLGTLNHPCTTITSQAHCPCGSGLHCVPNVVKGSYTSVYGTCQNYSIKASTIPPSTTVAAETMTFESTITEKATTEQTKIATSPDSIKQATTESKARPTLSSGGH
ncbi:hypothetical protein FSP39_003710 [Pinctada imbricata]|uniref:Uncharacterized protein n=1 Tax=Pinctada imbricata TaxID=66713 RepID=A0AA89C6I9_PINIB|nr:hypothetical protein FSP39_003710 [Pinctada imbricata]